MVARGGDGPEKSPISFRVAEGVELRGDAWGSPEGHPIVLLHGGGQTRHSWSGAAAKIASAGWYAVSLDLRGHGESDWSPDGVYGFESFTADTVAVARSFARRPVLVGASLGGVASLLAEGEAQESLAAGIVLVDVTPRMEPEGVQRIMDFMTHKPGGFETLEEAADAISGYRKHRSRPRDLSGLAKNLRQGEDGRWRWHWDPAFLSGDRSVQSGPTHQPERLLAAARRLTVPTLLVRGRESDVVSSRGADEFLEAAPHATFADVSGAGHMVAGDRNDIFADAVIEFLREQI
jgi:pimeloyl-ACP methyl ester carboxylesterase